MNVLPRRKLLKRISGTALATCLQPSPSHAAAPGGMTRPGLQVVLGRLHAEAIAVPPAKDAARWLQQQLPNGQWADIKYDDQAMADWLPMRHLHRVRAIGSAYKTPGHPLYQRHDALAAVDQGLRAWLTRKPLSTNWWHNTIGQQLVLARVLFLVHAELPRLLLADVAELLQDPSKVPAEHNTGQNRVWYAQQQVMRGALLMHPPDLEAGAAALQSTLKVTTDEGIQPDLSFHQHGPQLYSGGYGLGFLADLTRSASWLTATPWAFSEEQLRLLADYALEGVVPLVRGDWLDWGARGREFTRDEREPRPPQVISATRVLAALVPERGDALRAAGSAMEAREPPWLGNRLYWRSDFMVHQVRNGYLSVKTVSNRTVGTESGNGENLLGYWLPFGVTYIARRGDEYDGLPPVWDWSALPGLTAPAETPAFTGYQRHTSAFVGGVSDGVAGVATMQLDKLTTKARKSWFLHGDLLMVLAAGIESQSAFPVRSTLNQTRWRGPVATDLGLVDPTGGEITVTRQKWVWMDGITYLLLDVPRASLRLERRSQAVSLINPPMGRKDAAAEVMMLWANHGVQPRDARVAYGVWLGAGSAGQASQAPRPEILANSPLLQAVRHEDGLVQIVFHAPTRVALSSTHMLAAEDPCVVQVRAKQDDWQILVAEPTRQLSSLRLSLQRSGHEPATKTLRLPNDASKPAMTQWLAARS